MCALGIQVTDLKTHIFGHEKRKSDKFYIKTENSG